MIRVVHPGSQIRMLTFYPSRIPDPGVKKAPDPGSGSATLPVTLETPEAEVTSIVGWKAATRETLATAVLRLARSITRGIGRSGPWKLRLFLTLKWLRA
jgi:hypothetical protein